MLDDFSRYIVAWKLCTTMKAEDVTATLELALQASGLDQTELADRPRLLSDNGSSYIAGDLANWLGARNIKHLRGAPYHPMTQGKIERWHQTLKNRILLENYFLPGDLETQIAAFVDDYNHHRYHESIDNLTPADVYFGRGPTILAERERIKRQTIANRRCTTACKRHDITNPMSQNLPYFTQPVVTKTLTTDTGGTKLVLNVYRSWVGERAIRDLRRRVHLLVSSSSAASSTPEAEGIQASMTVAEVESIGGFVGGTISEPLLQGGILFSVLAYMIHVDFWMAGTAFALFVPQLFFVPLMQGAINRRTRARVQIIRQLSVSVVEGSSGNFAPDRTDDERIQHVFELNLGIYCFKFSMNFLMNLSTQLQIIGALLVGGWAVYAQRLEIGGVVAFISGIGRITDPWGDLVNYFRDVNITQVKYGLLGDAINRQANDQGLDKPRGRS